MVGPEAVNALGTLKIALAIFEFLSAKFKVLPHFQSVEL